MKYRVAVIGDTQQGKYGHGLDRVWLQIPETQIVAVADPDPDGRASAAQRLGCESSFADYREMLQKTQPDLVSICPRWLNQHHDMLLACAAAGVRGVYCEKPLCRDLVEADAMVQASEAAGMKVAVAHQMRYSPILTEVKALLDQGDIGTPLEFRGRGKEDRRGGGEDLWVLGTHVFDLIQHLGGEAEWCSAVVQQDEVPVTREHVAPGNEGIGPLASDDLHAMYGLSRGATAYFASRRNLGASPTRFGLMIYGSEGVLATSFGYLPSAHWLPDATWTPGRTDKEWIPITSNGPGKAETLPDGGLDEGNRLACRDLIQAIESDREPEASLRNARSAIEMIAAVFESHRLGRKVTIPLESRQNPLTRL